MRVLVITHGFPPQARGGSEIYAHDHASALAAAGHEVLVLARESDRARPERAVRVETRATLRVMWVNNTFADTRDFADSYQHPRLADAVMPLLDDWRPDVAHAHHLTCLSTRLVFDLADRHIPIVYTLHDYWLMCHRGQLLTRDYRVCAGPGETGCGRCVGPTQGRTTVAAKSSGMAKLAQRTLPASATNALAVLADSLDALGTRPSGASEELARLTHMKAVCARISHFLAPSRHMRDAFVAFGIDEPQITWSPYGFDHGAFTSRAPESPHAPLRLGFIGTLMVSKAPHLLLEAHQRLAPGAAEVHLYGSPSDYHGDDAYRATLAPLLSRSDVTVHGPQDHQRIPNVLATLDALVVPSVWPENSPLVIQEALLAGLPVVASRIGGIPELVVDGRNGLLFEPGSVADLVSALERLPQLIASQAGRTPPAVAVRTLDDDVEAAQQLYRRLLSERPSQTARVVAVVVHHRTPADTELCLRALRSAGDVIERVVLVNNDDQPIDSRLAQLASQCVETSRNRGFSGGVTAGVREALTAGATHVLLVNSDATVPPDTTTRLLSALESSPRAGIAAPIIAQRSRPDVVESAGISYNAGSGRMRHRGAGDTQTQIAGGPPRQVDAVAGCVMLIRREVFERVGSFEEAYFYGFEDIDFCIAAGTAGYGTVVASDTVVYHEGSQSIGRHAASRLYYGTRNHLLLARRLSGHERFPRRLMRILNIVVLNVAHAAVSPGASLWTRLSAVARGCRDYALGRFGEGR